MAQVAMVEYTDTFCGESNYAWVVRKAFICEGMTDRQIVRKAKALLWISGKRADYRRSWTNADMIAQYFPCTVMFITFADSEDFEGELPC